MYMQRYQIILRNNTIAFLILTLRKNRPLRVHDLKLLEREPFGYCKCDGKVIFTRPFLVTFDDHINALERYWKGDISYTFTKL